MSKFEFMINLKTPAVPRPRRAPILFARVDEIIEKRRYLLRRELTRMALFLPSGSLHRRSGAPDWALLCFANLEPGDHDPYRTGFLRPGRLDRVSTELSLHQLRSLFHRVLRGSVWNRTS